MRIVCPSCKKVYKIPREKLPRKKKITFPCPACKSTIKLDLGAIPKQEESLSVSRTEKNIQPPKSISTKHWNKKQPSGIKLKYGLLRTMGDLPAMPQIVTKIQELMADPNSSMEMMSDLIKIEPSIAANVLKLANSAYYGFSGKVSSIQRALVLLGIKTIRDVVIMSGISGFLNKTLKGYGVNSGNMWKHSIAVAMGSKIIAKKIRPELENDVFFAGIIHDIGKIILDQHVYERKDDFDAFMKDGKNTFLYAEKQILGLDHPEMAAEFCEKWKIPERQILAVRFHHYPSRSNGNELAYILHIADSISIMCGLGIGEDAELYHMEDGAMDFMGFKEEMVSRIMSEVLEAVEKIVEDVTQ